MNYLKISLMVVAVCNVVDVKSAERDSLLSGRVQGYGAAAAYAPLLASDEEAPSLSEQATISFKRFRSEVKHRNKARIEKSKEFKKGSFMRNSLEDISNGSIRISHYLDPEIEVLAREQEKLIDIGKELSAYLALVEEADTELQSLKRFCSFTQEQRGRINAREIDLKKKEVVIDRAARSVVTARPGNPKDKLYHLTHPLLSCGEPSTSDY